jgi:hypothetical protein
MRSVDDNLDWGPRLENDTHAYYGGFLELIRDRDTIAYKVRIEYKKPIESLCLCPSCSELASSLDGVAYQEFEIEHNYYDSETICLGCKSYNADDKLVEYQDHDSMMERNETLFLNLLLRRMAYATLGTGFWEGDEDEDEDE